MEKNKILIGMEPTGHYWKSLAYYLKRKDYRVLLVNPYHTKLSKEIRDNNKSKTDKKDSRLIAHLVREGKFLDSILPTEIYAELRKATVFREKIAFKVHFLYYLKI